MDQLIDKTYFQLPNTPEEFGVVLPPTELRRIDFSALEYSTLIKAVVEYMKTYYSDEFNDFVANNGVIMMMELVSQIAGILSMRSDILAAESFLPTSKTTDAVRGHLALINQEIRVATPATIDVELSVVAPVVTEILVPPALQFSFSGPDGLPVYYEIYRAPNDWSSSISIAPGKRGIIAWGIEGRFQTPVIVTASGDPDQEIDIVNEDILDDPFIVTVATGDETRQWTRVAVIERYGPEDEVYEVRRNDDGVKIVFGDNAGGRAPLAGQEITVRYRVGGGLRGRIFSGTIDDIRPVSPQPPASAPVEVRFRNPSPSEGGQDDETLDQAKRRAPISFAAQDRAVTGTDYAHLAGTYSHPVYGTVFKSVAIVKTSINANVVELYVLALGADDTPVTPSLGLKTGLIDFFEDINPITDRVDIHDGAIKSVHLEMDLIMSKNADAGTVKEAVESAIDTFFDPNNWDMGEALYLSQLYNEIQSIDGVANTKIYSPPDDILPTKKIADPDVEGIGFNEVIFKSSQKVTYFYELGTSTIDRAL